MCGSLLVLLAALSATPPPVAVTVSRRAGLPRPAALDVANQVTAALRTCGVAVELAPPEVSQRLKGVTDPETCEGRAECLTLLASKLGVGVVVAVEIGAVGRSVAIHLEALNVPDSRRLAAHDLVADQRRLKKILGLEEFATKVGDALGALEVPAPAPPTPPAPPPEPAPEEPKAEPAPVVAAAPPVVEVPPDALAAQPAPRSHAAGYVLVGTAAATAIAAGVCGLLGLLEKNALEQDTRTADGRTSVGRTYPEAQAAQQRANAEFTAALGLGVGAAALGIVAVVAW